MRRFKLQVQVTADGYMATPDDELNWLTLPWSDDLTALAKPIWEPVDLLVLGRKLAEGFIPAWQNMSTEMEDQETIDQMNNTPKVVFSRTLTETESPWADNDTVTVTSGDLTETITKLKNEPGGDLMTSGGVTLAQDLLSRGLLDDLYLFVNPTAIGRGKNVFPSDAHQKLQLVTAKPTDCGITLMHYQPKNS